MTDTGVRLEAATTQRICIDIQRLFPERTDWQVPWLPRVLPAIIEMASVIGGQTDVCVEATTTEEPLRRR